MAEFPENSVTARRALLVEDDDAVRRSLQLLLHWRGYAVRAFAAAAPAMAIDPEAAGVLVSDYRLPDMNGLTLLACLRARGWRGRALLITAFPSPDLLRDARAAGFEAVFEKPLRPHLLVNALAGANGTD